MTKKQLLDIGKQIVESVTIDEEVKAARTLADFFKHLIPVSNAPDRKTETSLHGGYALSPSDAASCLEEYVRTARFLKGVWLAINELFQRFPSEKIRILYAGCGPYGTILLPILPLFKEDQLEVTLLDIHSHSVASVTQLVTTLDLQPYIHAIVQDNAITYVQDEQTPLHMVITETMLHALIREPQVAISANLAPQIVENGILIPQEITIDMVHTFFAYEPWIDPAFHHTPVAKPGRPAEAQVAGRLFTLNKEQNFSQLHSSAHPFESDWYQIPELFNDTPDICLFTTVKIFGNLQLGLAESTITNPYCVQSLFNIADKSHFKLSYHFFPIPQWTVHTK